MQKAKIATQRETAARVLGSSSRVAPKKMKAPESGFTMENSAPKASKNVVTNSTSAAVGGANAAILAKAGALVRRRRSRHHAELHEFHAALPHRTISPG